MHIGSIKKWGLSTSRQNFSKVVMSQLYYIGRMCRYSAVTIIPRLQRCRDSESTFAEDQVMLTNQSRVDFFREGGLKWRVLKWRVSDKGWIQCWEHSKEELNWRSWIPIGPVDTKHSRGPETITLSDTHKPESFPLVIRYWKDDTAALARNPQPHLAGRVELSGVSIFVKVQKGVLVKKIFCLSPNLQRVTCPVFQGKEDVSSYKSTLEKLPVCREELFCSLNHRPVF